jgi:phage terminase large subunit-like protein
MSEWNLACLDWQDRIRQGRSLIPSLPLNRGRARRAVSIFNKLRLADVPGNPTLAEACGDWFRDIVEVMNGSLDDNGKRHVRELFCLVPKKNSKTSYGAGLMLTALLLNERPKAPFGLIAPTQDITEIAYSQVSGMIRLDDKLQSFLQVQDHLKKITDHRTGATLEVMSFDPSVLTGQKWAGVLVDELHVVATMAKALSAVGQIRGGMIAYEEAFLAFITTQSEKPPGGVFRAELWKARAVRDGKSKANMLPVLYEFPPNVSNSTGPNALWRDHAIWHWITPNAGRSITIERLVEDYTTAVETSEEELRRWASQHLNLEIGVALGSDHWIGAAYWENQADPDVDLDLIMRWCDVIVVGIDGGGLDDLLGLAVLGRHKDTRNWLLWTHAWAHPIALERRKAEAGRLKDFEACGDLTIIEKMGDDIPQLVEIVERIHKANKLAGVGLDPAGIGAVVDALAEKNIAGDDLIIGISQGFSLQGAIKTTERKLADGSFIHGGQPMMDWVIGNAKVEPRGNAIMITKQAAGAGKIDPLMATFDAVQLMSRNPEIDSRSRYEERGLLVM